MGPKLDVRICLPTVREQCFGSAERIAVPRNLPAAAPSFQTRHVRARSNGHLGFNFG